MAIREVTRGGRVTLAIELPYGVAATLTQVAWSTERATGRLAPQRTCRDTMEVVLELGAPVTLGLELRLQFAARDAGYDEVCLRV